MVSPTVRYGLVALPLITALGCVTLGPPLTTSLQLDVAPIRRPCVGEAAQLCLQVRPVGDSIWTNLYDDIEGFRHEPGILYRLLVERMPVPRSLADGSSSRFRLVRECRRERTDRLPPPAPERRGVAECR